MAINVDTVYKTVLLILNSEQRGYMTPDEFNRIGSQVQRQIFEAYFEDLNQQLRVPQSDMEYSDRVAITDEKIAEFKTENDQTVAEKTIGGTNPFTTPSELYRLGSITYEPNTATYKEMQRVGRAEIYNIRKAPLTAPTTNYPIYLYEDNKALVYPETIVDHAHVKMQYVKKPTDIRWGYNLGALGQYIFTNYPYVATAINIGDISNSISSNTVASATNNTYVNASYTGGTGTGATFDVVVSGATVTSITVTSQGSGYVVGDQITFQGSDFGGTAGTTVVLTLTSTDLFSGSTQGYFDFGLHNSERTEVILRILLYAGVVIRDPQIIQVAAQKVQQEEVNEKS
jgi:hypothetical protein